MNTSETDIHVQKWLNNFCQLAFYIFHYRKIFLFLHVVYQNVTCFEFYTRLDFYVPFNKINKELHKCTSKKCYSSAKINSGRIF